MTPDRNWGKLAYPTFLENTWGRIFVGGELFWEGKCIFDMKIENAFKSDANFEDVVMQARVRRDLSGVDARHLEFVAMERRYLVQRVQVERNPDGSFHYSALHLRELGDGL